MKASGPPGESLTGPEAQSPPIIDNCGLEELYFTLIDRRLPIITPGS